MPTDLRDIIRRGLEADPDARWPAMEQLLDALARREERRGGGWLPLAIGALGVGALAVGATLLIVRAQANDEPPELASADSAASIAAGPSPSLSAPSVDADAEVPPPTDADTEASPSTDANATPPPSDTALDPPEHAAPEDPATDDASDTRDPPAPSDPARKPKPPTKKKSSLPETVSDAALSAALASVAKACSTAVPRTIWVEFAISEAGRVSSARALPPNDASTLGGCVLAALRAHTFPASRNGVSRRKAALKVSR